MARDERKELWRSKWRPLAIVAVLAGATCAVTWAAVASELTSRDSVLSTGWQVAELIGAWLVLVLPPALWLWCCSWALRPCRSASLLREVAGCALVGSLPGVAFGVVSQPGWPLAPLLEPMLKTTLIPLPLAAGSTVALLVTLVMLWTRRDSPVAGHLAPEP